MLLIFEEIENIGAIDKTKNDLGDAALDNYFSFRNRMILEVLYGLGVRISELVQIKDEDLSIERSHVSRPSSLAAKVGTHFGRPE